ncbi:hypothetical protein IPM44_01475 [bacterium]|nr:MAG: hypothetical protein IPM44_01475 [bacterium]
MTNRTARTEAAEIALARHHRAEHDNFERQLEEVGVEIARLNAAIADRNDELTQAASQTFRTILREEVAQLERQLAERGAEQQDILQQLGTLRTTVANHDRRLGTLESRTTCLRGDVDGLQAHSEAHASAISQIQAANGWIPPAAAAVAGFITYLFIEWVVDAWRVGQVSTHIQWAWTLAVAAIVGLITSLLTGEGHISARTSSSASAGAGTTPALPPADQPVTATQVVATPAPAPAGQVAPPPPPTGQFPTVQAAAAAVAQTN